MSTVTQEREIDGIFFTVTQLPGMRALKMFSRLGRILGPAVARGLAGAGKVSAASAKDIQIDGEAIGEAIGILFERLSEAEIESITRELLETATADGAPLFPKAFDLKMQGRTFTVLKLLKFAIEVNFGSFFGALREFGASQLAGKGSKSPSGSPNTSETSGQGGD